MMDEIEKSRQAGDLNSGGTKILVTPEMVEIVESLLVEEFELAGDHGVPFLVGQAPLIAYRILHGIAAEGEELPLYAFLASRIRDPNDDELRWAKDQAKAHGIE